MTCHFSKFSYWSTFAMSIFESSKIWIHLPQSHESCVNSRIFAFTMRQSLDKLKPNFPFATAGSSIEKCKLFAFAFTAQFISSFFPRTFLAQWRLLDWILENRRWSTWQMRSHSSNTSSQRKNYWNQLLPKVSILAFSRSGLNFQLFVFDFCVLM